MAAINHASSPAPNGLPNASPARGTAQPLPHIDDVTAAPRDIDGNQSIKKLLEQCESSLKTAELMREFNKDVQALKGYLRSYIIAVQTIEGHRDYAEIQHNQSSQLHKKHIALLQQIKGLWPQYDGIKKKIIENNRVTGVQRSVPRPSSASSSSSHSNVTVKPSNQPLDGASPAPARKPEVRPKPQALHGNALKSNHARASSASSDLLAARFAKLQGPAASPGQDPRIKTHAFAHPLKPVGPREMPPGQLKRPTIGIDSSVPSLPQMPNAIYSPARGNMSEESVRMPSSTPRGFSRTGSSTSTSCSPSASSLPPSKDYFTPVYSNSITSEPAAPTNGILKESSAASSPRHSVDLAKRTIVAEELFKAMKTKNILIIDIRSREQFDDSHIMSRSIICIEPDILTRPDLNADDIAESLVLSPGQDQILFERRDEFDLVVFYDDTSKGYPVVARTADEIAIMSLHRALVHLSYARELKQTPLLLKGGLEAWADLLGPQGLESTRDSSTNAASLRINRTKSKYRARPMAPDDVRAWQEKLRTEEMEKAASTEHYRTTEDFLRRFPEVSREPEDMSSTPASELPRQPAGPPRPTKPLEYQPVRHAVEGLPAPLTQPKPAVSRPNHSGNAISSDPLDGVSNRDAGAQVASARTTKPFDQMTTKKERNYTRSITTHDKSKEVLGDSQQHDAHEFMSFVLDELDRETNRQRHVLALDLDKPLDMRNKSVLDGALEYWSKYCDSSRSISDQHCGLMEVQSVCCQTCKTTTYRWGVIKQLVLYLNERDAHDRELTLQKLIRRYTAPEELTGFHCDACRAGDRTATIQRAFPRMPALLLVTIQRYGISRQSKIMAEVTWDLDTLDMAPFHPRPNSVPDKMRTDDKAFMGPFKYECVAVVEHYGDTTNSGHYTAYVRDPRTHGSAWLYCDDSRITKANLQGHHANKVFRDGSRTPYVALFRMKSGA
ncbi:uncharacterized protein J7T54_006379 [Emericellopsis cladophorae]|uniref:USP domain-containing protein n=1 Tax=Emericellopsis cladophorae TaxID=2686198 RepID=A0A9P9Y7P2_9HYPO|nr:uncharacterized protein J7T54_006379 [Emericellopsis cladophorae]KAI6784334.1 hypothetical protein J7T54_006379 [Emericellopsis cladophorae]